MQEKVIASATKSVKYGDRRKFVATVKLTKLEGNTRPYFSATGDDYNLRRAPQNQVEAFGCLHDEIVRHFPELAPVVRVHLSDDDGTPMHMEANALYWLGRMQGINYDRAALARHLRVTVEEADAIHAYIVNDPTEHDSESFGYMVRRLELRARWAREAGAALAAIRAAM